MELFFNGVDDGADGADKHLTHLSQGVDCCLMERSKQNKHVIGNKGNDVDNGYDNGYDNSDNDSVDNGDDGVDYGDDGADKHLAHLSQAANCCLTERSNQNEHVVCNKDDDVGNGVDNGEDDNVDNGVDNGVDGADKHLTHLSQVADCCLADRSKQNKH
eukprot:12021353-Ditylum_brightwellii.AAC.1